MEQVWRQQRPHALVGFLWACALCVPVLGQQAAVTPEGLAEAVEAVAAVVAQEYFHQDVATRAAQTIREHGSQGRYAEAQSLESLAWILTRDLFEATKDKHLVVRVADHRPPPALAADEARAIRARRTNYGIRRVEVLGGNVGYLDLTDFYRLVEARDALTAAMYLLRSADAMIVDMRDNSGGSPETVALLTSYFFDLPKLPLFEIIPRVGNARPYATASPAIPDRNAKRPAFVLTAKRTFSAGEGFAFILQERRRATIIGEQTAGAANPGRPYPAGRFEVTIPNGQVRTAVTGRNWEGNGVFPDVQVPAADALYVAHIMALRELLSGAESGPWQQTLKRHLERLEGSAKR